MPSHRPFSLALSCALAALPLTSCDDPAPDRIDGLSLAVDQAGPFAVGYRDLELSYTPRDGGPTRTVQVAVFYPADPEATAARIDLERPTYLVYESEVAFRDAPVARPAYEGGFPVLLHSHGHAAYRNHSFHLGEMMASLGFVMIAPEHEDDTINDLSGMKDALDDRYERFDDLRHALDLVEDLPSEDPLAGKVRTDRVIATGHSRGGYTVWGLLGAPLSRPYLQSLCDAGAFADNGGCPEAQLAVYDQSMRDPRVVGGIPMASRGDYDYFGGLSGLDQVEQPVMMMTATNDPVGVDAIMTGITHPDLAWVEFAGGCHDFFASALCPSGAIDNSIGLPAMRTYVYAFARRHLLNDASPDVAAILDGTRPVSATTTYRRP